MIVLVTSAVQALAVLVRTNYKHNLLLSTVWVIPLVRLLVMLRVTLAVIPLVRLLVKPIVGLLVVILRVMTLVTEWVIMWVTEQVMMRVIVMVITMVMQKVLRLAVIQYHNKENVCIHVNVTSTAFRLPY